MSRDHIRAILSKVKNRLDRLLRAELREQGVPEEEIDRMKRLLGREG